MNMYSNNYLENQIATASREKLLIMFYDGAIRFCNQALKAIADNKIEQRNYGINKANAIITELSATLDHELGGKIAEDLDALYAFMNRELNRANLKNDPKPLETVIGLLTDLRETWKQAIELNRQSMLMTEQTTTRGIRKSLSVSL